MPHHAVRVAAASHTAAATNVRLVKATPAAFTNKPGGYAVVGSVAINVNGLLTEQRVSHVPDQESRLDGPARRGAETSSSDLAANINSSWPSSDGKSWDVDVNTGSSSASTLTVHVVCAKKLEGPCR